MPADLSSCVCLVWLDCGPFNGQTGIVLVVISADLGHYMAIAGIADG